MLHHALVTVFAAVPDPGQGTAPPGSDGVLKILKWGAWLTFVACVLGVFACAGKMALNSRHGHGAEHGATLGWVMGAAILAGSASALVGALV